jgi:hypothetical protein
VLSSPGICSYRPEQEVRSRGICVFETGPDFDPDSMGRVDPDPGRQNYPSPLKKKKGKNKLTFMEAYVQLVSFLCSKTYIVFNLYFLRGVVIKSGYESGSLLYESRSATLA